MVQIAKIFFHFKINEFKFSIMIVNVMLKGFLILQNHCAVKKDRIFAKRDFSIFLNMAKYPDCI